MDQNEHIVKLLEEIRDNQKEHMETYKEFVGKYLRLGRILRNAIVILFLLYALLKFVAVLM